jgi:Phage tail assembly chaperone protein
MHALIENNAVKKYPYSIVNLKTDYPNTSFPVIMSEEALASYNVLRVYPSPIPTYDVNTQVLGENTPVFDSTDNQWTQTFFVRDMTDEEKEEHKQGVIGSIRDQRNALLAQSDWTQLTDSPETNKPAWAVYRQELRDVSKQSGYPFNVVWPNPPV